MENKENLYIPMGIKEKNEFWDGFASNELKASLKFIFIAMIINGIGSLLIRSLFTTVIATVIIIVTALMLNTKGTTNLSVMDQIGNMRSFSKSQKQYEYKSLDEWR